MGMLRGSNLLVGGRPRSLGEWCPSCFSWHSLIRWECREDPLSVSESGPTLSSWHSLIRWECYEDPISLSEGGLSRNLLERGSELFLVALLKHVGVPRENALLVGVALSLLASGTRSPLSSDSTPTAPLTTTATTATTTTASTAAASQYSFPCVTRVGRSGN